jgi:hypothetical protein
LRDHGERISSIQQFDEIPNDFEKLLCTCAEVTIVGFNGRKAYELFDKHVVRMQRVASLERLRVGILPSSSTTPGRSVLPLDAEVERRREFVLP